MPLLINHAVDLFGELPDLEPKEERERKDGKKDPEEDGKEPERGVKRGSKLRMLMGGKEKKPDEKEENGDKETREKKKEKNKKKDKKKKGSKLRQLISGPDKTDGEGTAGEETEDEKGEDEKGKGKKGSKVKQLHTIEEEKDASSDQTSGSLEVKQAKKDKKKRGSWLRLGKNNKDLINNNNNL